MKKEQNRKKFAVIVDDFDRAVFNKNLFFFAEFLTRKGAKVDIITNKNARNNSLRSPNKDISIIKIDASLKWPQLENKNFYKFINENIKNYFAIWLYRGRPYASYVIELAIKEDVITILKLDSDRGISKFGKLFFKASKLLRTDSLSLFNEISFVLKIISKKRGIKGFIKYDIPLLMSSIVICETREDLRFMKKIIPSASTIYYPNSIPVKKNTKFKKKKLIISVGRISKTKGFENVIRAFALLPQELKNRWSLEIIGPVQDENYKNYLIAIINKLQIRNVKLIPGLYGNELIKKHKSAQILLMLYPIKNKRELEGQPNVLLDGMQYFNAIITSDIKGTRSLLGNRGENGVIVSTNDPKFVSQKLEKLIIKGKLRTKLQEGARLQLERNFSIEVNGEKLYKKILRSI